MERKRISIFDCKAGDKLAHDITNDNGTKIVVKDTVINPFIQEKLIELGIREIFVYSELANQRDWTGRPEHQIFHEKYDEGVSGIKKIIYELSTGNKVNAEALDNMTTFISNRFHEDETVVQCLCSIKSADEYTYTHSLNTSFYAMLIGKWMKLTTEEINILIQAGLLHDIGKTQIPPHILNKHTILTKDEYEEIKKHTVLGYEMLADSTDVHDEVKRVVLFHHERFDQSGYPYHAGPHFISIFARIVAVADVYDAITSPRIYKERMTPFTAFEMFNTVGMSLFDPMVVNTFLKNIITYFVGAHVRLNTGDTGKIVYIPPFDVVEPIINVNSHILDLSKEKNMRITQML